MREKRISALILILAAVLFSFSGCGSFGTREKPAEKEGLFFDTEVSVRIYGEDAEKRAEECMERFSELEKTFSPTDPDSELYRVNQREADAYILSPELASCLQTALELREKSGGLFEPAIRPLSLLWTEAREKKEVPDEKAIKNALRLSDGSGVKLQGRTLTFQDPKTMLDLGAAAKGYISGHVAEELLDAGVTSALLNLGGNVRAIGKKPDGSAFKIGVQKPFSDRGTILFTLEVQDACVISSGVYERFFELDGVRYHHILSPLTGMPADTDLLQVTVCAEDDLLSDACSTLFMLTGEEEARQMILREQLQGTFFFTRTDGSVVLFDKEGHERVLKEGENVKLLPGGVYEEK